MYINVNNMSITITIKEMANELGVTPMTIYRYKKAGKLKIKRLSSRLYSRKDWDKFKANF